MRWAATFAAAALAGLAAVWWFAVALDIVGLILGTDGVTLGTLLIAVAWAVGFTALTVVVWSVGAVGIRRVR